jgi:hypothetical protein
MILVILSDLVHISRFYRLYINLNDVISLVNFNFGVGIKNGFWYMLQILINFVFLQPVTTVNKVNTMNISD